MKIPIKITYILEAIIGILILWIIIFLLQGIQESSQELVSIKKDLVLLDQQVKDLESLQGKYKNYQLDLEKINNFFVEQTLPIGFIKFLEKSALNSQASIKVSLAKEITEPEPALSFNASFSGSFSNFLKFIDKLENGPYLVEITNLNVKDLAQESSGNIMANLVLIVLTQ